MSKSDIPNKTDFMKYSVSNFLESERAHVVSERSPDVAQFSEPIQAATNREDQHYKRPPHSKDHFEEISISDVRIEPSGFAPKRYVTTCYLKTIHRPFWYSETVQIKLGSTKKRYFEDVFFKNALAPVHWRETMNTEVFPSRDYSYKSCVTVPCEESEYHYISLEPQQIISNGTHRKELVTEM